MIEVVQGQLDNQAVAALMLSANNRLKAGSGWSYDVERLAGPAYAAECRDLAAVGLSVCPLGAPLSAAAAF